MTEAPIAYAQYEQLQRENFYMFLLVFLRHPMPGREFRRAPHVEAMCFALERVMRGEIRRLIITVPPRHLKSITVAAAFVAWVLGRDPSKQVMVASYGADLAEAHARNFRTIIREPRFQRLFPAFRIRPDRDTADKAVTTKGGHRLAISVGGRATGQGADLLICDNLLKAGDANSELVRTRANAFFDETLYSRLNIKSEGAIIVIQQRLHRMIWWVTCWSKADGTT